MKKIAIFTEGQGESIFVRHFLQSKIDNSKLSFEIFKLYAGSLKISHYCYSYAAPDPAVHFFIVDVGGDTKVLSEIKERESDLLEKGYIKIIGLRDMYCEIYQGMSPNKIDDNVSNKLIESAEAVIKEMKNANVVSLYFSIMELESWFLSMYKIFGKFDPILTVEYINEKLGFNLKEIDPQKEFYQPTNELKLIFELIGLNYNKSHNSMESICSKIENSDFEDAFENDRCMSFKAFYEEAMNYSC